MRQWHYNTARRVDPPQQQPADCAVPAACPLTTGYSRAFPSVSSQAFNTCGGISSFLDFTKEIACNQLAVTWQMLKINLCCCML